MTDKGDPKTLKDEKFPSKEEVIFSPQADSPVEQSGESADSVLNQARKILDEYGGQQANIPVHSDYWSLMNRYRALVGQKNK